LFLSLVVVLFGPLYLEAVDDIEKKWVAQQVLAQTNAYGAGGTADLAADQAYDYQDLISSVDLGTDGYEGTQITFSYDASGTTDDIIFSVFASPDGTDFDDIEYWSVTCDNNAGADTQMTFIIRDLIQFRIGVKTSGTTDTFDYELLSDRWNWEH